MCIRDRLEEKHNIAFKLLVACTSDFNIVLVIELIVVVTVPTREEDAFLRPMCCCCVNRQNAQLAPTFVFRTNAHQLLCAAAVSYTHLDVYKRQCQYQTSFNITIV